MKLEQVFDRVLVVCVDRNPFRALRLRIDRLQSNGQCAGKVLELVFKRTAGGDGHPAPSS
jgi:hypothetical protein